MNRGWEKLLVVESDRALREGIASVLRDAGYEVSTDFQPGMEQVLEFRPAVVILDADLPKLDCCDLLSEIKGFAHIRGSIKWRKGSFCYE